MKEPISKLPWFVGQGYEQTFPGTYITSASGLVIASEDTAPSEEDAAFIVEVCNNAHETRRLLQEAYKALRSYKSPPDLMEEIGKFLERTE